MKIYEIICVFLTYFVFRYVKKINEEMSKKDFQESNEDSNIQKRIIIEFFEYLKEKNKRIKKRQVTKKCGDNYARRNCEKFRKEVLKQEKRLRYMMALRNCDFDNHDWRRIGEIRRLMKEKNIKGIEPIYLYILIGEMGEIGKYENNNEKDRLKMYLRYIRVVQEEKMM